MFAHAWYVTLSRLMKIDMRLLQHMCRCCFFLLYLPCHRTYNSIWNLYCNLCTEIKTLHLLNHIKMEISLHCRNHIENLTMVTPKNRSQLCSRPITGGLSILAFHGKGFIFYFFQAPLKIFTHTLDRALSKDCRLLVWSGFRQLGF